MWLLGGKLKRRHTHLTVPWEETDEKVMRALGVDIYDTDALEQVRAAALKRYAPPRRGRGKPRLPGKRLDRLQLVGDIDRLLREATRCGARADTWWTRRAAWAFWIAIVAERKAQ